MIFKFITKSMISSLFPNTCASCGQIIDENKFLCDECKKLVEKVNLKNICPFCEKRKINCECNTNKGFSFSDAISPFYTVGTARNIMYSYKFNRKKKIANFFAYYMAKTVKTEYVGIKFDGICYTPLKKKRFFVRGFNQSKLLAVKMSKILDIPIIYDSLMVKNNVKLQHTLSSADRFKNVKGKYKFKINNNGKTLLLVDDIKTTGATLDECARQLILSGANKIYAVTGLVSKGTSSALKGEKNGN